MVILELLIFLWSLRSRLVDYSLLKINGYSKLGWYEPAIRKARRIYSTLLTSSLYICERNHGSCIKEVASISWGWILGDLVGCSSVVVVSLFIGKGVCINMWLSHLFFLKKSINCFWLVHIFLSFKEKKKKMIDSQMNLKVPIITQYFCY